MNSQMFTALSEPNRLDIIELLYKSPRTVNEIAGLLKLNQPQTSKHLRVLADAGVVEVHPLKNQRIYQLKQQPFKELDQWLGKFRKMWEEKFNRLDHLLDRENDHPLHTASDGKKEVKKNGRK